MPSAVQRVFPVLSPPRSNKATGRIEGEEDAIWASVMLNAEFLHVGELRPGQGANMRTAKSGAAFFEQPHREIDAFLLLLIEAVPPCFELRCELDLECRCLIMHPTAYSVKRIISPQHATTPRCVA
jgi:hypothetical protein